MADSQHLRWNVFAGMSSEQTQAALALTRRRKFARGEIVFHEGDPGDTLHLIESGHVAVRVSTPYGETATLRVLGPGDQFGELALVAPAPRSATVVALDPVETLSLHEDHMVRLRLAHPEIDRLLLETVVREVRRLSAALLETMYVPVPQRLSRRLVELADLYPADDQGRTAIPLTQDDLAGLCGTTRPTVNQLLGRLSERGLIEVARGRVVITDVVALRLQGG
jgi:CRP/FNR family transcriptional regulator, cyclic AMP receptor protein